MANMQNLANLAPINFNIPVKYKLTYMKGVYGRAEIARLIFAISQVEYEEHLIDFRNDWPSLKPEMPFGKIPVLYVDDEPLSETGAINRYLANKYGFCGVNLWEQAQCEMYVGALIDATAKFPWHERDSEVKAQIEAKLWKEITGPNFEKVEQRLASEGRKFLVGHKLSYADMAWMQAIFWVEKHFPEKLQLYPALCALRDRVAGIDGIKQYLEKRPNCPY